MKTKITLDYPVELAPHPKVTEMWMRRPKVADELAAKKKHSDPADIEIFLLAALTGQAVEVIQEMDLFDYDKLQDILGDFRLKGAATSSGAAPTTSASDASASPASAST
ncbi:MAG: phage tail assembly protein [Magnetospirillum sp.]|nr:MAG: phage tail assembly protein [Magnetospirillum sp.]